MISPGKATALILQTAVDRVRGVSPTLGKVSAASPLGVGLPDGGGSAPESRYGMG